MILFHLIYKSTNFAKQLIDSVAFPHYTPYFFNFTRVLNSVIICLTDCSGNGEPILTGGCGARCSCFGGWQGEYCQRIVANGGGDPHLKTLDGM